MQLAPLGLTQGFAKSFYTSSTGQLAILLLSSQERKKIVVELLNRNNQNLNVRPSGARCSVLMAIINGPLVTGLEKWRKSQAFFVILGRGRIPFC